ncbi:density-regulated protein, partial [Tachysurus ichikawai]
CSLPTEYCEYMPEPAKCRQWLEKNFPDMFARMTMGNVPKSETGREGGGGGGGGGRGVGTEVPPAGEEEEKKKQKR